MKTNKISNMEKLKIGVCGLSENAGATFVAVYLARMLGEIPGLRPALVELEDSKVYDALALIKYFDEREYFYFFEAVQKGETIRGKKNLLYGVNWACQNPHDSKASLSPAQQISLVNNISANIVVSILPPAPTIPVTSIINRAYEKSSSDHVTCPFKDMELVLIVMDPLPSRLMAGYGFLCNLLLSNKPAIFLINKMNRGVSERELYNFLRMTDLYFLPLLEAEYIYGAEFSGRQVYDFPQARALLDPCFKNIVKEILNFV